MDPTLANKILSAQRKVQTLWGEQLTLGAVTVPVVIGQQTLEQNLIGEGLEEVIRLRASIIHADLPQAPAIGSRATARGRDWRVFTVEPTQTTYELTLQSPNK